MRTTAVLAAIALLLAGSTYAQNAAQQAAPEPPPLCGEDEEATTVRIDIDSEAKTVYPKECVVAPGTTVVWWEDGDAMFESSFTGGTPDSRGAKKFKSTRVGGHHEAKFKAKNVNARASFNYDVTINGETLDPTVIVDPNGR